MSYTGKIGSSVTFGYFASLGRDLYHKSGPLGRLLVFVALFFIGLLGPALLPFYVVSSLSESEGVEILFKSALLLIIVPVTIAASWIAVAVFTVLASSGFLGLHVEISTEFGRVYFVVCFIAGIMAGIAKPIMVEMEYQKDIVGRYDAELSEYNKKKAKANAIMKEFGNKYKDAKLKKIKAFLGTHSKVLDRVFYYY